ncbi:hypothetical protein F4820DRAFT_451336 [Hypoxylon rubiginosum]|uniref:Uncharacterized protein n=1 Tax=Hypoxylon rubiginosum TaxID=110542 RepID=A0ACB9YSE3_9PEZI|nr:hypothetical protein F4820DRAFT_451336 [Hypoxylon rubiginosum]
MTDGASKKAKQSNTVDIYLGRGRHCQYDYEKSHPNEGERAYSDEGQLEGSRQIPTLDGPGIDLDLGDSNYQHVPESSSGYPLSARSSLETIFGHVFAASPDPWEDQTDFLFDDYHTSDYFLDPTPDSISRSSSKCVSPSQLSTSTIMNTEGSLSNTSVASEDLWSILKCLTKDELMQLNRQPVDQQLPSESSSSLDITELWEINRSYDDGHTNNLGAQSSATRKEVPAIPRPRGRVLGKDSYESRQPTSGQCSPSKRRLACPWYKKDPLKYQDCAKYKLQRVKDVKQHIYRKHMQPSERSSTEPKPDEISEDQRKALNENANRGKTDVEQWLYIWDTIFPGEPHPRSPHLGSSQEEVLALLRNLWDKRRAEITASVLPASQPGIANHVVVQRIMDSVFDWFEAELSS